LINVTITQILGVFTKCVIEIMIEIKG
jgi:hypothetical protein